MKTNVLNSFHSFSLNCRLAVFSITISVAIFGQSARAVDGTWNGTTNSDYNTGSNWSGNVVPAPAGNATFNNASNGNTALTNTTNTINLITFDTASAAAYTLGSSGTSDVITLDSNFAGGTIKLNSTVVNSQIINSNIVLGNITGGTPGSSGNYNLTNLTTAGGPTLTLNGNISGYTGGTAGTETLALNGPGTGFINGNISNGGSTALAVTTASGTWTMAGANTHTGATTVNTGGTLNLTGSLSGSNTSVSGGTLNVNNTGSLGGGTVTLTTGTLNINNNGALGSGVLNLNGGTIGNTSGSAITFQTNNPAIMIGGNFAFSTSAGNANSNLNLGTGAVTLAGNRVITLNGTGTLTFGGTITNTADSVRTLTVDKGTGTISAPVASFGGYALTGTGSTAARQNVINGSGNVNITGAVTNGVSAGSGLLYSGTGTLALLSGSSTYTGGTRINSGTLAIGADSTPTSGAVTSGPLGTGTLTLGGGTATVIATGGARIIANALTVASDTPGGIGGSQNLTFSGNFFNTSNWTTLAVTNTGLTTFSGGVTMNGLKLFFQGTGDVAISSNFTGSNNFGWENTGTLTLSGAANSYTGPMAFSAGTVTLDYTTNNTKKISGSGTGGALILGGVTLKLNGGSTAEVVASTTLAAGASTINQTGSGMSTIDLKAITRNAGSTLAVGAGGVALTSTGTASTLFTTTAGVVGVVGGNDWAAKNAGNTAIVGLSTVTSYNNSTSTTVSSGNSTDVVTDVTLGAAGSTQTLRFDTANARTITATGQTLNLTQGGILVTSAVGNNLTIIIGGNLSASNSLFIFQNNTSNGLTIASNISSAGALTKSGAGLLILSNSANGYTGKTYLNQGTLNIASDTSLGTAPGSATADQLTFNGGTLQLGGTVSLAANRGITLLGNGGTIDTNGNSGTVNGIIAAGSGNSNSLSTFGSSFTKTGGGTLTLLAANTYRGPTLVSEGKLIVNGSTSTGTVTVSNGATLGGTGTIGGATTIQSGGIHAPGNSPGIEKFTSSLTYADGSIFAWDIDRTLTGRGTGYDAVNVTGALAGLDGADDGSTLNAVFRIVIGDSDFSDGFWSANNHTWTDIFTNADGTTAKTDWAGIFGGGFQYYNSNGSALAGAPTTGSFSLSGNTLSWNYSAVPEVSNVLAGALLAAGLLRRKRRTA